MTCQEPMKISIQFHTYIRARGPTPQRCMLCGAVHMIDGNNKITLNEPGHPLARLSQEYPYPEYAPYRVGAYRVRYSNGNWSKALINWDGEKFNNGPILFREGSITSWQGLAGDMEHTKTMPYELQPVIS